MASVRGLLSFLIAGTLVPPLGCDTAGRKSRQPGNLPSVADETGQGKCKVAASSSKPLVVEWAAADRTAVEAGARRGLVAVRYAGCEMELLPGCVLPGKYGYIATSAKRENVRVTSQDELYAQMPVGALRLEAQLQREGELNVEMMIVGRLDADTLEFSTANLPSSCARATHLVAGITVGAFQFYAGRGLAAGVGAGAGNVGVGAKTERERSLLSSDGDVTACAGAKAADASPPAECSAMLRLEVVPIPAGTSTPGPVADTGASPNAPTGVTPGRRPTRSEVAKFIKADPELSQRYRRRQRAVVAGAVLLPVSGAAMIGAGAAAGMGGGGEWVGPVFGVLGVAALGGIVALAVGVPMRRRLLRETEEQMMRGTARYRPRLPPRVFAVQF